MAETGQHGSDGADSEPAQVDEKGGESGTEREARETRADADADERRKETDDSDNEDDDSDEPPEDDDDGMPPLADEPGAGIQAYEMQRTHSHASHASHTSAHRTPSPSRAPSQAPSHSRPPSRAPSQSRPPSLARVPSRTPTVVPRSKRRGLFGQLTLIPEVERPYDYPDRTKWTITLIIALSAAGGPLGSSIFYPALSEMAADLHASPTVTNLTVALYMLAMSIFPLWWWVAPSLALVRVLTDRSSFSESFGRRSVYIASFSLFVVFSVLSAVSRSIGMLIVMRILGGGASASVQAVGAGTLADIWKPAQRGRAMGIFYLGPLTGPLFAPIIGGALAQHWGWQSTMWFLTIFGGLTLLMLFFCLPETLNRQHQAASRNAGSQNAGSRAGTARTAHRDSTDENPLTRMTTAQSVRVHTQRLAGFLTYAFVHPLSVLRYLRFPPILLTAMYGAVTFGALFVLNVSVQSAFSSPPYAFGELVVGLLYIPCSLGYIVASVLGGRWIDNIMAREARKAGRFGPDGVELLYLPEDRMRENAWLAASLFPAAFVWFGWSVQYGVLWVCPIIANFFFGVGSMLVFGAVTTMLTEFMPRRSSGGIALNNFLRNIFSCVGAIVTQPLVDAMGFGWLSTMVALAAWIVGNACIWALRRNGAEWRKAMDKQLK